MKELSQILLFLLGISSLLYSVGAAEPVLPFMSKAPVIDGKVSPKEWSGAQKRDLKKFNKVNTDKTTVYFGRDQKNFYAAFVCNDSNISSLKRQWSTPEERDNAVWNDDCVEFRFDPWNTPQESNVFRHIIINPNGVLYDAVGQNMMVDFNITAHTFIGKNFWSVEFVLPLSELTGYQSNNAELWRIMMGRSNPRTREVYTFSGDRTRDFKNPVHFLTFRSGKVDPAKPFTIVGFQRNRLHWRSENNHPVLRGSLELFTGDYRQAGRTEISILNKNRTAAVIPARLQKDTRILRFTVAGFGQLEWQLADLRTAASAVQITEKPLYKELWSDQAVGLAKNGSMTWGHGFQPGLALPIALEFGIPWEEKETLQTAHKSRLRLQGAPASMFTERAYNWQNKAPAGAKFVGTLQYFNISGIKAPVSAFGKRFLLFDPEVRERYLAGAVSSAKKYREYLYALSYGDEVADHEAERFLDLAVKHRNKNTYPAMDKMCLQIKNKYGHGKFGPPESMSDSNPYRWIAFRSFIAEESVALQKDLKAALQKEQPGIYLYSDDPQAGASLFYDFTKFDDSVCDILTIQLYPAHNAAFSDFSFISKYVRDLATVKEFHPCFHIENYGGAFTPLEMLEKVSQGFRGGANGFHWYLADTRGTRIRRSLCMERYGAPERWLLLQALQDEVTKLPPLKFPEADCGFFVPVTTLRSYPGLRMRPAKIQMLHSLLELQSGAWFKYFNERSLQENLVDLDKFKTIFIADSKYSPAYALSKLSDYVRKGGTLVITDPEAFSFDSAGNALKKDLLPGLDIAPRRLVDKTVYNSKQTLPLFKTASFDLNPPKGSEVLLRYKDGKAAAIKSSLGKGSVIVFGVNFAQKELVSNSEWQKFFREFTVQLGIKLDHDIWRFRFPEKLIAEPAGIKGRCISGNHISFRNFRANINANVRVPLSAAYTCTPAADAPAEPATVKFSQGKLFDRRRAYAAGNVDNKKFSLNDRVVGWSSPGKITIEFDLTKQVDLDRVELFYVGALRDVTVSVSNDGKSYRQAGFFPADNDSFVKYGVRKKTLQLPREEKNIVKIKLEFAAAAISGAIEQGEIPIICRNPVLTALPWKRANFMLAEIELFQK